MPLTITVQRGFTFVPGTPWDEDDLNAAALPAITIAGSVGSADLEAGAVNTTHVVPGPYAYALATGSANAYAVTLSPAPSSLTTGLWLGFKANFANTGAATINVNGLGAKAIVTPANQALIGGEIVSGQLCWVQYDGTSFQIISDRALPKTLYAVDAGSANAYVVTLAGVTVSAYSQLLGQEIIFKAAAANTGASTLNVNGLGAIAITKQGSTALSSSDIQTGGLVSVAYDGTQFQMTSFVAAPSLPSIGAAGTFTYPYSLTIDAAGRVTAASGGGYAEAKALPAKGASQTFTHGLGRTPRNVRVVVVMGSTTENGFTAGDELEIDGVFSDVSGGDNNVPIFTVTSNSTSINVSRINQTEYMNNKSGSAENQLFDGTLWTLKVYAE